MAGGKGSNATKDKQATEAAKKKAEAENKAAEAAKKKDEAEKKQQNQLSSTLFLLRPERRKSRSSKKYVQQLVLA